MMALHELGHVLHAAATGGRVARVVLHPLTFSRTDVTPNPRPLCVAWGGLVWGCILPLVPLAVPRIRKARLGFLLRFFAGFCLLANGAYAAAGVIDPVGDAAEMIRLGTPAWVLAGFGVPVMAAGLALWNGIGRRFGLAGGVVDPVAVWVAFGALLLLALPMFLFDPT